MYESRGLSAPNNANARVILELIFVWFGEEIFILSFYKSCISYNPMKYYFRFLLKDAVITFVTRKINVSEN